MAGLVIVPLFFRASVNQLRELEQTCLTNKQKSNTAFLCKVLKEKGGYKVLDNTVTLKKRNWEPIKVEFSHI